MLTKKDNKFFRTIFGLKKHPVCQTFHVFSKAAGCLAPPYVGPMQFHAREFFTLVHSLRYYRGLNATALRK